MKKLVCLFISCCLLAAPAVQAMDLASLDDIDAIMEDNALQETANRYSAVQLSFFPENATRLGYESANNKLDLRSVERDAQALRAYHVVTESFKGVRRKNLSESKKTEYDMLQARLALDKWNLNRERTSYDPLLYSAVFNSVQDLTLKKLTFTELQNRDLAERIFRLTETARQAEQNLSNTPSFLAQLAMEDAYYAYLSFDIIPQYLQNRAHDTVSRNQLRTEARASKEAVKKMFDLFKKLAQDNAEQDFRLGERNYVFVLKNHYFITDKPSKIEKLLTKNFKTAQQTLAQALEAFVTEDQAETRLAGIQVPGEETGEEGEITVTLEQDAPTVAPKAKKNKNLPLVKASDFYTVAQRLIQGVNNQNFTQTLAKEAADLSSFFVKDGVLPYSLASVNVREMPAYYAYSRPYLFVPPYGTQTNPSDDFFLRLPSGNELTKQEMLNRDFNAFTLKLVLTGQLVPGLYYRSDYAQKNTSMFRRLYPVPTLRNGWEVYAQHLAKERGYIVTDAELLFLAWADYVRAAKALTDFYLHTKHFTYGEALAFLTEQNGFDKAEAEQLLKDSAREPGEAVSYIYGYNALKNLRAKYQKKQGKKFSAADFHAKVLAIGDIPPARLEAEMEHAYKLEKSHLTQALSTPFYMN